MKELSFEQRKQTTIGIITALPKEYVAVKAVVDNLVEFSVPGRGAGRRYLLGEVPAANRRKHIIALSLADVGNSIAAARATLLLEHFPNINTIIMVGIAGGVPFPDKPDEHVRLGDIVVSNKNGVIQYDFDKETLTETGHRHSPRPPSATLLEGVRLLEAAGLEGKYPWIEFIERVIDSLEWVRPDEITDILANSANQNLTIEHPLDRKRQKGQPRIFVGPIASANKLLKNPIKRDELRDKFGFKAVEMEGSGIADATWNHETGYLVVRGICDYCDTNKGDLWQEYAAIVAAAYVRSLLETIQAELYIENISETEINSGASLILTRNEVKQRVRSAREKGESPDLRGAQLVETDLAGEDLARADLSKANLSHADFEQANLEEANLSRANLYKANLYRTHLKGANLRRAEFEETKLFRPTLTDADFSEVDLSKAKVDLDGADLKNAKLFETNLEGINLNRAILTGAEYSSSTKWPENFNPKRAGAILRMSCDQYGIKIKHPQNSYIIREHGNTDINVSGVYKEKPSDHYLCIIVANKDRNRFWRFPERIAKEFNEDSKEWSVVVPFQGESDAEDYEVLLLAALVAKEDFAKGEYSSLPPGTIVCDEVLVSKIGGEPVKLEDPLTYRSRIRLVHMATRCHLHSHSIDYNHPKTSGQQQITAFAGSDANDYWIVKGPDGKSESFKTGQPIENGDIIRLEHQATRMNLHSHRGFLSPITSQQEVTAFGVDGVGNFNDNWIVEVDGGERWYMSKRVRLIHAKTRCTLHSHAGQSHSEYTTGQQEVTCFAGRDDNDWWYGEICN